MNYKGAAVRFNTDGWINATDIALRFGKRLDHWLANVDTLAYVQELDEISLGQESEILHTRNSGYVKISKARKDRGGGTWLHQKLVVAFARWCDPKFSVWCDLRIVSLLRGELSAQQRFERACSIRDERKSKASKGIREMARWRWDKSELDANVDYWRDQV